MKSGCKQSDEICDAKTIEPLVTMCFLGGMWCMVCGDKSGNSES